MYRIFFALFLSLIAISRTHAQLLPKEGSILHYRVIGFSFPGDKQSKAFRLEIAKGYFNNADSFKKNIINTQSGKAGKLIVEVPAFGTQYTWRAIYDDHKTPAVLHHFSTGIIPFVDTNTTRLRVTQQAKSFEDAYIFHDGARAIYDMKGNPVWYLPNVEGIMNDNTLLCDLKTTPQGTITFMLRDRRGFEISYNGDILWRAPNNNLVSRYVHYHHELTRLANGHYMILGTEPLLWKRNKPGTNGLYTFSGDVTGPDSKDTAYKMFPFGTLIEYDEKGNVVWQWSTSKYVLESDLNFYAPKNGMNGFDVHVNAFFFDQAEQSIYLSFRDISRVVKIKYPQGNVLNTYGQVFKQGIQEVGKGLFCGQHSCRRSEEGYLYLYNNNICSSDSALPKITVMEEPLEKNDILKKVWEYEVKLDGNEKRQRTSGFTSGGNVIELPGQAYFVSMSSPYGKLFIVNHDKGIIWSGQSEQWSRFTRKWETLQLYRASIITRTDLEHLIWNEAIK